MGVCRKTRQDGKLVHVFLKSLPCSCVPCSAHAMPVLCRGIDPPVSGPSAVRPASGRREPRFLPRESTAEKSCPVRFLRFSPTSGVRRKRTWMSTTPRISLRESTAGKSCRVALLSGSTREKSEKSGQKSGHGLPKLT